MTYDNIKSHKKKGFALSLGDRLHIFKLTPSLFRVKVSEIFWSRIISEIRRH